MKHGILGGGVLAVFPAVVTAQNSPFLPDPLFTELVGELSGDRAYENVRHPVLPS